MNNRHRTLKKVKRIRMRHAMEKVRQKVQKLYDEHKMAFVNGQWYVDKEAANREFRELIPSRRVEIEIGSSKLR